MLPLAFVTASCTARLTSADKALSSGTNRASETLLNSIMKLLLRPLSVLDDDTVKPSDNGPCPNSSAAQYMESATPASCNMPHTHTRVTREFHYNQHATHRPRAAEHGVQLASYAAAVTKLWGRRHTGAYGPRDRNFARKGTHCTLSDSIARGKKTNQPQLDALSNREMAH